MADVIGDNEREPPDLEVDGVRIQEAHPAGGDP
jgi:hypothetical protein